MRQPLRTALRDHLGVRTILAFVGVLALFRLLLGMDWDTLVLMTTLFVVFESFDIAREIPDMDERYLVLASSVVPIGIGLTLLGSGEDLFLGALTVAVGGWLLLDTVYNFRHGLHPGSTTDDELRSRDAFLLLQVGNLVAEELEDGPRTVPELADACDMTESRVRDALQFHERAGTVYRKDDRWVLDESKVGPWAFVRDTTRRIAGRLLRPARLFVPS